MTSPLLIHTEASRGWGGQEMRTLAECRWFRDQGYRIALIAPEASEISAAAAKENFTVHHRELTKKTQLPDFLFCRKLFKKDPPLMVGAHSNIDTRVCLAAATAARIPNRFRYRHVSIPVKYNPWNRVIYRKFATQIITTAEKIAIPLREDFELPAGKVITIATGVAPPDDLPTREQAHRDLCSELKLPPTSRFIGQVSILRRWKGHTDVMTAFEKIAEDYPNHHLVFVGGGHGEEYLPPFAKNLACADRIHFMGHHPNPWPFFRAFEIATLASTEGEGIPQSGMQAMLSGCPFIGTSVGGIPEIITHAKTGLLVPPSDPSAITAALKTLLEAPLTRQKIAKMAYDWALENTTLDRMGKTVESLLTNNPS
ncbi:glycosyltransferase family 4 protein [Akkermansiaceae bacterium]|nr:glycosyltransferase family 4 protein [Akkermansiaceae bacterium]MDB4464854.1 glycosyltransferase family 4 protein [Akkermansiaceae bacterium]MDB4466335.1 glycosyltransferase family 4 protein [bacterium]